MSDQRTAKRELPTEGSVLSCTCTICAGYCESKPGWLKPGEAEAIADHLGISLQELFDTKLMADYWGAAHDILVLSPAVVGRTPGRRFPFDPRGRCVFLTEDRKCAIHAVKPFECRVAWHGDTETRTPPAHEEAAHAWNMPSAQQQILDLLPADERDSAADDDDDGYGDDWEGSPRYGDDWEGSLWIR